MMYTQPRVFRGRGGPTDRRLPKHNARRRKPPKAALGGDQSDSAVQGLPQLQQQECHDDDDSSDADEFDEQLENHSSLFAVQENQGRKQGDTMNSPNKVESLQESVLNNEQDVNEPLIKPPWQGEIDHLMRRIRNNRSSMTLSATSLGKTSNYQSNVLQAVMNCIREWSSILRHFAAELESLQPVRRATGLAIFELIQQALQSGPLSGSKPGYFKRCGSEVARIVLDFLNGCIPDRLTALALQLTEKQADAVQQWKEAASHAIESDQVASKSVLKKQEEADKHRKKKP